MTNSATNSFTNAADFGFLPDNSPANNVAALQMAFDKDGTIIVSTPGTYNLSGTVYIGSNTTLKCGSGVIFRKVAAPEPFTHVILNKGALTRTYDSNIVIEGLHIEVNGVDKAFSEIYGLRGQLAFFYVKDLRIERFRCYDVKEMQFCIHVCTFEDLIINDVIIKGMKDGVHLGLGKRFTISNGVFQTYDDAVALNAHDYATSNPELGWLKDGIISHCYDLPDEHPPIGFFSRILAGGWSDWQSGMEVQHSDSVIHNGRLYRVQAKPDKTIYKSVNPPVHESGTEVIDDIPWAMVQDNVAYTAGVRNVTFRDISLQKARTAFSLHFDHDQYSRSYYPNAEIPVQRQINLENVHVQHDGDIPLVRVNTPVDVIRLKDSAIKNNQIVFYDNNAMPDYKKTSLIIRDCSFEGITPDTLIDNRIPDKELELVIDGSVSL